MQSSEQNSKLGSMIVPMPGKIAVKVSVKEERTPSGLLLPEHTVRSIHEERPTHGVIVAIGDPNEGEDGSLLSDFGLAIGDRVVFGKFTGTKMEYQPDKNDRATKEILVIMSEKDVLCKLTEPTESSNIKVKS